MGVANERKLEVLLVEPDELMARMVVRLLGPTHTVSVAQSVDEALRRLDQQQDTFDVVLCTLALPMRSGIELYQEVAQRDALTARRFVFLTDGIFSKPLEQFLETVDNPRLEKPFMPDELYQMVAAVVRRH